MKFTDPIVHAPKPQPPKSSWWTAPAAQSSRGMFTKIAKAQEHRIVGHQTFGGRKRTHNKFDGGSK